MFYLTASHFTFILTEEYGGICKYYNMYFIFFLYFGTLDVFCNFVTFVFIVKQHSGIILLYREACVFL